MEVINAFKTVKMIWEITIIMMIIQKNVLIMNL